MRVLVITKIFPNALEPLSNPFNRQQFAALARLDQVEVLATIPWFPGARAFARDSTAGRLGAVPREDRIDGLTVHHPRFLYVPKIGHALAGPLYAASLARAVLRRRGQVDVVLGSWAYPDGFAAVVLARLIGVPAVIKLHGTDMNLVAHMAGPRAGLRWALPRASRVVAVSRPLAEAAVALGVPRERIDVVENGVDRELFHPRPRAQARAELGQATGDRCVLYVGRLEPRKGVLDLIAAVERLGRADLKLVLLGDGPLRDACEAAARRLSGRLLVAGARPLPEVALWMAAADAVALPSHAEGMPNVVLEALSCGRRVVGTRVGGIPDLIDGPQLGELVAPRDVAALAAALARAVDTPYDAEAVAAAGGRSGWNESAARLHEVLLRATGGLRRVA